jgi:tetratricopeptide (TPR) repeat protein
MRWACWIAAAVCLLGGCASTGDDRAQAYSQDGLSLFQRGRYQDARESFQAALVLRPNDAGLLYDLGQCCDRVDDTANAEHFYQQCLERAPDHAPCHHALAALLVRQGRRPEAVRLIEGWLARQPRLAAAYAEDGWLLHQGGDLPAAQARLQQALQFDPRDQRALTELGLIYESMQRPDRAVALYERALGTDPHQPELVQRVSLLKAKGAGPPHP